jgi:hypothetical protein
MAPNGRGAFMVNGPGLENRFGRAEDIFDRPKILIDVSDCLGVVVGVSPQHPDTVVARLGLELFFIDDEVAASFDL